MDGTIIAALITVTGTLVGVWLGSLISKGASREAVQTTHKNAIELLKLQNFSNACFLFTNAFIEELNLLELTSKDAYVDILRPAFPKHKTAVYIFRQSLSDKDRLAAFDKAWEEYYKNEHQADSPLRQYSTQLPQTDNIQRENRRPLAIARIKALLKFTENK
jgi:hypothetical protein